MRFLKYLQLINVKQCKRISDKSWYVFIVRAHNGALRCFEETEKSFSSQHKSLHSCKYNWNFSKFYSWNDVKIDQGKTNNSDRVHYYFWSVLPTGNKTVALCLRLRLLIINFELALSFLNSFYTKIRLSYTTLLFDACSMKRLIMFSIYFIHNNTTSNKRIN